MPRHTPAGTACWASRLSCGVCGWEARHTALGRRRRTWPGSPAPAAGSLGDNHAHGRIGGLQLPVRPLQPDPAQVAGGSDAVVTAEGILQCPDAHARGPGYLSHGDRAPRVSIHEGRGAPHSRRRYLRLRAGPYRITYTIKGDLITILRVERRTDWLSRSWLRFGFELAEGLGGLGEGVGEGLVPAHVRAAGA